MVVSLRYSSCLAAKYADRVNVPVYIRRFKLVSKYVILRFLELSVIFVIYDKDKKRKIETARSIVFFFFLLERNQVVLGMFSLFTNVTAFSKLLVLLS